MIQVATRAVEIQSQGETLVFLFNVYEYRLALCSVGILARQGVIDWIDAAAITKVIITQVDEVLERSSTLCARQVSWSEAISQSPS